MCYGLVVARYRYLLGDSGRELGRLRAQARLWDPVSYKLFDRLKIKKGWNILEIGPGACSLNRELRRRRGGPVDAVERSPVYAAQLPRGGRVWNCDLLDAELPQGHYDLIFARWVFLFLPRPLDHLRKLAAALKPGGLLAVQDYQRESMGLSPRPPEWEDFCAADKAFFATQGGDANAGARLPGHCAAAGLKLVDIRPEIKWGRPGSAVWGWASTYFLGVLPRYGKLRPMTPAKARSLARFWRAQATNPAALLTAPAVLDVVAKKP